MSVNLDLCDKPKISIEDLREEIANEPPDEYCPFWAHDSEQERCEGYERSHRRTCQYLTTAFTGDRHGCERRANGENVGDERDICVMP
jgi:hypothetical protein